MSGTFSVALRASGDVDSLRVEGDLGTRSDVDRMIEVLEAMRCVLPPPPADVVDPPLDVEATAAITETRAFGGGRHTLGEVVEHMHLVRSDGVYDYYTRGGKTVRVPHSVLAPPPPVGAGHVDSERDAVECRNQSGIGSL